MESLFEAFKSVPGLLGNGLGFWIALFTIILLVTKYVIENHTDAPVRLEEIKNKHNYNTPRKANWNILSIGIFIIFLILLMAAIIL
jgi:hypothetical protein